MSGIGSTSLRYSASAPAGVAASGVHGPERLVSGANPGTTAISSFSGVSASAGDPAFMAAMAAAYLAASSLDLSALTPGPAEGPATGAADPMAPATELSPPAAMTTGAISEIPPRESSVSHLRRLVARLREAERPGAGEQPRVDVAPPFLSVTAFS